MTQIQQAPESLRGSARASFTVQYKGRKISLSKLQCLLFILLADGKLYSSHKIMQQLHTSDPRKEIQYLRRKGINVCDVWVEATPEIPRHKMFWIEGRGEVCDE